MGYIDELQAICNNEVSEEYDIINYTCFQAYTERFDESAKLVVSIEIYEIDPDSYLFKKNFLQFSVMNIVNGFSIVKQKYMFFWNSLASPRIQRMLAI